MSFTNIPFDSAEFSELFEDNDCFFNSNFNITTQYSPRQEENDFGIIPAPVEFPVIHSDITFTPQANYAELNKPAFTITNKNTNKKASPELEMTTINFDNTFSNMNQLENIINQNPTQPVRKRKLEETSQAVINKKLLKSKQEKNREAARRYREGQRNTITNLENQNIRLIKENDALNMEIISLKREVDYWKQQAMNQASQNIQQQTIHSYPTVPIQPPILNLPNYQNHPFFNQNTNITTRANPSTSMTSMLSQISYNKKINKNNK